MTDRFEVHGRDGAARIGELRLAEPVTTPALADDFLADAGSRWPAERAVPEGRPDRLTVLPHRGLPGGTPDEVATAFAPAVADVDFPSAAVVSPATAADLGTDAYVLSGARALDGHASAFREAIVTVRGAIPPDTALHLPGVATPANVATLVYAGVDLVDADRAVVEGTRGRYLTADGARDLDALKELPCACPACRVPREGFTRADCVDHNVNALEAALTTARQRVREGRLRDYLEGQARHEAWLTAALREFDDQWGYLEAGTPIFRRAELVAATEDSLRRVEIRRFADRVTTRYRDRFDAPLVLLPCSARKPYSDSQSHKRFYVAIAHRGHVVSMTSPIGVVPTELELTYPAQHYDTPVTGRWSAEEVAFVAEVLRRYLDRTDPPRVVAHVPDEGYRAVVERAVAEAGYDRPVAYTVDGHPTDGASLDALSDALDGEPTYSRAERLGNTVRGIADYQFGDGAGDALLDDVEIRGRYPSLQVLAAGTQLATLVPQYGLLALTLDGARRWAAAGDEVPVRRVGIDAFVPHGSVLAPGVIDAWDGIRVGDEVLVEGPSAFGVGRAAMGGDEMVRSTRGVAVDVRHVEER